MSLESAQASLLQAWESGFTPTHSTSYTEFYMFIINYSIAVAGGICPSPPAGDGTVSRAKALSSTLPFAAHVMELFWGPFLTALPFPGLASPQIWPLRV